MSIVRIKRVDWAKGHYRKDGGMVIDHDGLNERGWVIELGGSQSKSTIEVALYISREVAGKYMYLNATLTKKQTTKLIRELQDVLASF